MGTVYKKEVSTELVQDVLLKTAKELCFIFHCRPVAEVFGRVLASLTGIFIKEGY